MFKRIRNKILLLNMVMVSSVVIIAFALIFTTTYTRVRSENLDKLQFGIPLHQLSGEHIRQESSIYVEHGIENPVAVSPAGLVGIAGATTRIAPDAGLSFSVFVDSDSSLVAINSMIDLPPETYESIAGQAMANEKETGMISMDGRRWQYLVSPTTVFVGDVSGLSGSLVIGAIECSNIRFLDVTDSVRMVRSLALLLSGLSIVILVVFFFISRYFAGQAIRPMREAWDKQNRFITDASHELRTPLSVINANCGVLYEGADETVESQLKWVDSIARASDRMAGLVNSLLSLLSMEDAQPGLQKVPLDLSGTVLESICEMEAAALEKNLRIQTDIEPDVEIRSDRESIEKVLSILLDNAIKYTVADGEISVSLKSEKHDAVYTVRNSGEGIPSEELPRVFDRFYRGDPARSSDNSGYGLGLAIAKSILERLDAEISAESVAGEYTQFTITFEV